MKTVRLLLAAALALAVLTGCYLFVGESTLVVVNGSIFTIDTVFISPVRDNLWGADWLDGTIAPGASRTFEGIPAGVYDIRAEDTGPGYWEFRNTILPRDAIVSVTCSTEGRRTTP